MDEHRAANSGRGHETTDADIRAVVKFAIGLFLSIVASLLIVWVTFNYFVNRQGLGPPASPFEDTRNLPPPGVPVLQAKPSGDYRQYFEQQKQLLDSYGWVDQQAGVVRLPVDRAMDLLIRRGLPVLKETGQSEIQPGTVPQYTVPKGFTPER
jgi:hypothetical protein